MKILFIVSLAICLGLNLSAQDNRDFEITLPESRVSNSLYNSIRFIDSRFDTTNMGIVQLGAFNRKAKVKPRIPFTHQLQKVLSALTDSTAANGELLFQLRQLSFAEITGAMSEKGYCYFRADLYGRQDTGYRKISSIDTVLLVKSMDVTKALFRNGSKVITGFISNNLLKFPLGEVALDLAGIVNIDSIEKSMLHLYNTRVYKDGVYSTYETFKNQVPDEQGIVELKKDSSIHSLRKTDGSNDKIRPGNIYALVYNGRPYAATEYGFYRLNWRDNDFYFTGKARVTANSADVIAASMFFGVIGGLIASDANAIFEMKIDHSNGGHIRIRQVAPDSKSNNLY